ncbi:mannose-1-phosphate guanylyltransferase/mannose-6-phosphate isomerase [Geminicoccaceae bacterium 1502E]|nr:mannose-1-phosphate guanylyltransferase/mannose-6-phosphate isomerase [Geminicoccaceae bacterium 1502E]
MSPMKDLVPVILAGGSGTRLWPVSRAAFPKHLVELVGEESLLQTTARRTLKLAGPGRILTVAAAGQAVLVRRQLRALDPALAQGVMLEPEPRNTAAAVALAAFRAARDLGPQSLLWVCPSDHLMLATSALMEAVAAGLRAAAGGRIVTFGIAPSRAETGFGWIARGEKLGDAGVFDVRRFVEKPPAAEAQAMLEDGGYLWNSGMFLMRADTFLEELERLAPEIHGATARAFAALGADGEIAEPALYGAIPSAPVDKAVMERTDRIAVVPCDPRWSDVGSWHALWELMDKDAQENAVAGEALLQDASRNLVRSEHRLVALAGVRDLAVIETADAILVADRTNSEAVRGIVAQLAAASRTEATVHAREARPWGQFTNLGGTSGFRVREVVVDPEGQLTLQRHDGRDEHWIVVEGRASVQLGSSTREVPAGNSVLVPRGTLHRLANAGPGPLRVIEVQVGEILGEEATERLAKD